MGTLRAIAIGRQPKKTLVRLLLIVAPAILLFLLGSFVFLPIRVTGPSMVPTFKDGEINFINRLAYLNHEPQRGDIVGIRMSGKHMMYVKRVVGLPGETVEFSGGILLVNGKPLPEPYLTEAECDWVAPPHALGSQDYYVVGDNRTMPYELHEKGAANRNRILGKAMFEGHHAPLNN
jgi:signal peptidase I